MSPMWAIAATKLMILGDVNQARPQAPNENTALNARRPYLGFRRYGDLLGRRVLRSTTRCRPSSRRRFSGGFYLLNSFTWSKAIDNASGHLEANNGDNSRVNYLDLRNDKGVGSYDQPFNNYHDGGLRSAVRQGPRSSAPTAIPCWTRVLGGWRGTLINTHVAAACRSTSTTVRLRATR